MVRRAMVVIVLIVSVMGAVGCGRSKAPSSVRDVGESPPTILFDSGQGTGQYDQMTYAKYESQLSFTPQVNLTVRAIRPQVWYCNGSSGFTAFIRDEHYQPLADEAGLVDGSGPAAPTFSDRHLDSPVTLMAGKKYLIVMEVWTTKSVGIYTTGNRTGGIVGAGQYMVDYAHSDTADHLDRGAIAFQLLE